MKKKYDFPGKTELIRALNEFVETNGTKLRDVVYDHADYRPHRGETILALAFAKWLKNPETPENQNGFDWFKDLPELLDEAYEEFRQDAQWKSVRKAYAVETGHEIPSLVNIHQGGLDRVLVVASVIHLMTCLYVQVYSQHADRFLSGRVEWRWLQNELDSYLNAQAQVIEQAWKRFVRKCYRPFMKRYKTDEHTGNSGKFGNTHLLTFGTAGRMMFTFRRGDAKNGGGPSITYVADDSDDFGNRAGPNTTNTPYIECVQMINEVVDNWDLDKLQKSTSVWFG